MQLCGCFFILLIKILKAESFSTNTDLQVKSSSSFVYLLVIDFEATCWDKWQSEFHKSFHEIIEFPCILYDVIENKILSEFQQYVRPVEHPHLSEFCKNLTGIQQNLVDNGTPLGMSLLLFSKWLREQEMKYNFSCDNNNCVAATWSDWDLGNCLKHECWRKKLKFPTIFNDWIDVRALYRKHYLRGTRTIPAVLLEVGLTFEGREHCGLHDSRNIANLINHMLNDGVVLRTTSSIITYQ